MLEWWPISEPPERLRERLQATLLARVAVVSVFLGMLAWSLPHRDNPYVVSVGLLMAVIAATYAFTIASALLLLRLKRLNAFAWVQVGFDLVLITWVLYITGGADSPFAFLYNLVVLAAATLFASQGAVAAAAASSIAYAALVAVLQGGWVARPDYPIPPAPADVHFAVRFAATNGTFLLIAILGGSLVKRARVSERLLQERESERDRIANLQEAVARSIESALITTDAEGCITSANQVARALTGTAEAGLVGRDVGDLFPPLRNTASGRLQFLQSSPSSPTEFMHRCGDDERTLRCSASLVRDTYQNPIGGLLILQDVSTLRRLEEKVQRDDEAAATMALGEMPEEAVPVVDGFVGNSPGIQSVRQFIAKIARTDATVLVSGESGTGKELVARAVHARSARGSGPFVTINCGAIPENLIESELFGHAKGAFTGAISNRVGLFRSANGGTVFLDEIGELPLALQVKMLRVLQEHTFTPVGSDTQVTVDVRVIAATNRGLADEVAAGRFREDLFYRINVLGVDLPPLRERREDIPLLLHHFIQQFADLHRSPVSRLSAGALRRLQDYSYPGNIRELENIIEHSVALAEGDTILEDHLPPYVFRPITSRTSQPGSPASDHPEVSEVSRPVPPRWEPPPPSMCNGNLDDSLAAYEKSIMLKALAEAGGVKKRAADILGINYRSFRHRLQKYGLNDPGDPGDAQNPEQAH